MDEITKLNNELSDDMEFSIELGFNGELSDEYYKKKQSVLKVRKMLKIQLISFISIIILFLCVLQYNIVSIVFIGVGFIAVYKNIKVWIEIRNIKLQRFKDYYEKQIKRE